MENKEARLYQPMAFFQGVHFAIQLLEEQSDLGRYAITYEGLQSLRKELNEKLFEDTTSWPANEGEARAKLSDHGKLVVSLMG